MENIYPFTKTTRLREADYPELYQAMVDFCQAREIPLPDLYIGSIDPDHTRKSVQAHATYPKYITDAYVDLWQTASEWNAFYSYPSPQAGPKGAVIIGQSLAEAPLALAMSYFAHEIGHMHQSPQERAELNRALGKTDAAMVLECKADHFAANEGYGPQLADALAERKSYYDAIATMEKHDPYTLVAFYGTRPLSQKRRDYLEKHPDHASIENRVTALENPELTGRENIIFNPDCTVVTPVTPACKPTAGRECR